MDNNLAVLEAVKNSIAEECKKHRYSFGDGVDESKLRCPNEKEQRQWLIGALRRAYIWDKRMTLAQYRTVKGEIRKGHLESAFNFMVKRGYEDIREKFNENASSKHIYETTIPVTFPKPVETCVLEINVNKEDQ